jgi:hypothetical protein
VTMRLVCGLLRSHQMREEIFKKANEFVSSVVYCKNNSRLSRVEKYEWQLFT